jgi:cell division septum initiation protein DivIVA
VVDSRMKGRVKGLLAGTSPDEVALDEAEDVLDPDAQRRALQVLVLAQRTADEHVSTAQSQAGTIRSDARATAEQIVRDAQAHADGARQDASKALSDAHGAAEQIVRDAQAQADGARREADKTLADARAGAAEIVKDAQAHAAALERDAEEKYEDAVGSLAGKRAALQEQIEALQQFDRDYRARLATFMQGQLRALGASMPVLNAEIPPPNSLGAPVGQRAPEQRSTRSADIQPGRDTAVDNIAVQ